MPHFPNPDSASEASPAAERDQLRQEVAQLRQQLAEREAYTRQLAARLQAATGKDQPEVTDPLTWDEEFIQALLHNLAEGIIACDRHGRITLCNAAARRLLGLDTVPAHAHQWTAHCRLYDPRHGSPLPPSADPLQRALAGESVQDVELAIAHPPETPRIALVNGDPIWGQDQALLGAVIVLRDTTTIRQTTAFLREREAFLRSIYDGVETCIFVVDVLPSGMFQYVGVNPAYERLTGISSDKLQGKTPQEVHPPEMAAAVCDRYRTCVEANAPLSYEEWGSFQAQMSWWLTTLKPLQDEQGQVYRLIGTSINITRRKQAEDAIQTLNADLEQRVADRTQELTQLNSALLHSNALLERRNQELDQFVYVASHDLKAPLRAISNLSAWLEEDLEAQLPEENREQLQLLRGRVHRMEALINALLEYSRVGRKESKRDRVDLNQLLAEVIDSLGPPENLQIEVPPNLPTLNAKRLLLHQVFANLISNAIKYIDREDGYIRIGCEDVGDAYRFVVADNGPGIDPKYHDKIFGVFRTLHARDQIESTGIGLSIVKKILDTEGGQITVESDVGAGASFYVTWPKHPSPDGANPTGD